MSSSRSLQICSVTLLLTATLTIGCGASPRLPSVTSPAFQPMPPFYGDSRELPLAAPPQVAPQADSPSQVPSRKEGMVPNRLSADGAAPNTETYKHQADNPFYDAKSDPLSTFSVDVDTGSYTNVRRILNEGRMPPADAVRLEEMINYFSYGYSPPKGSEPIAVQLEAGPCPWSPTHRLVRIGLQARNVDASKLPARNLVFLLDVSGSMEPGNRLPMVKQAIRMLVDQLNEKDRVAIVTYANGSRVALQPTAGSNRGDILAALNGLEAGGGTNGAGGIKLAYEVASSMYKAGEVNRVLLATDGDFNLGMSSEGELIRLIEQERASGVFLSTLGVGEGNYKDAMMEQLADHGNGNYSYLDSLKEAEKVLVKQAAGTLITVAKDVKIQVEMNPAQIAQYRLVGYEDRVLANQDFTNDKKDAGDMGAGHSVTALYEVVPVGAIGPHDTGTSQPSLRYQTTALSTAASGGQWMTLKLRFKAPEGTTSEERVFSLDAPSAGATPSPALRLATSVAEFGMLLRDSKDRGASTYEQVEQSLDQVDAAGLPDPDGLRRGFRTMVEQASRLSGATAVVTSSALKAAP